MKSSSIWKPDLKTLHLVSAYAISMSFFSRIYNIRERHEGNQAVRQAHTHERERERERDRETDRERNRERGREGEKKGEKKQEDQSTQIQ